MHLHDPVPVHLNGGQRRVGLVPPAQEQYGGRSVHVPIRVTAYAMFQCLALVHDLIGVDRCADKEVVRPE